MQIDAAPFKQWYQQHYGAEAGYKKRSNVVEEVCDVTRNLSTEIHECLAQYPVPVQYRRGPRFIFDLLPMRIFCRGVKELYRVCRCEYGGLGFCAMVRNCWEWCHMAMVRHDYQRQHLSSRTFDCTSYKWPLNSTRHLSSGVVITIIKHIIPIALDIVKVKQPSSYHVSAHYMSSCFQKSWNPMLTQRKNRSGHRALIGTFHSFVFAGYAVTCGIRWRLEQY